MSDFVVLEGDLGRVELEGPHANVFLAVNARGLDPPPGTAPELTRARTDISVGVSRAPRFRETSFALVAATAALQGPHGRVTVDAFETRTGEDHGGEDVVRIGSCDIPLAAISGRLLARDTVALRCVLEYDATPVGSCALSLRVARLRRDPLQGNNNNAGATAEAGQGNVTVGGPDGSGRAADFPSAPTHSLSRTPSSQGASVVVRVRRAWGLDATSPRGSNNTNGNGGPGESNNNSSGNNNNASDVPEGEGAHTSKNNNSTNNNSSTNNAGGGDAPSAFVSAKLLSRARLPARESTGLVRGTRCPVWNRTLHVRESTGGDGGGDPRDRGADKGDTGDAAELGSAGSDTPPRGSNDKSNISDSSDAAPSSAQSQGLFGDTLLLFVNDHAARRVLGRAVLPLRDAEPDAQYSLLVPCGAEGYAAVSVQVRDSHAGAVAFFKRNPTVVRASCLLGAIGIAGAAEDSKGDPTPLPQVFARGELVAVLRFEHRGDRRVKTLAKALRKPRHARSTVSSSSGLGVPYETVDPDESRPTASSGNDGNNNTNNGSSNGNNSNSAMGAANNGKRERRKVVSALAKHRDASASEGPYATMPVPRGRETRFGESHPFLVERGDMGARHAALVVELYDTGENETSADPVALACGTLVGYATVPAARLLEAMDVADTRTVSLRDIQVFLDDEAKSAIDEAGLANTNDGDAVVLSLDATVRTGEMFVSEVTSAEYNAEMSPAVGRAAAKGGARKSAQNETDGDAIAGGDQGGDGGAGNGNPAANAPDDEDVVMVAMGGSLKSEALVGAHDEAMSFTLGGDSTIRSNGTALLNSQFASGRGNVRAGRRTVTTGRDPHGTIDREDLLEILGAPDAPFSTRTPLPGVRQHLLAPRDDDRQPFDDRRGHGIHAQETGGEREVEGIDATPVRGHNDHHQDRHQPQMLTKELGHKVLPDVGRPAPNQTFLNGGQDDGAGQHQRDHHPHKDQGYPHVQGGPIRSRPPTAPVIGNVDDGLEVEPVPDDLALDGVNNNDTANGEFRSGGGSGAAARNSSGVPALPRATSTFLEQGGDLERAGDVPTARRIAGAATRRGEAGMRNVSPAMSQMHKLAELAIAKQDHLYALVEEASENASALEKVTSRLRSLRTANESLEASNERLRQSARAFGGGELAADRNVALGGLHDPPLPNVSDLTRAELMSLLDGYTLTHARETRAQAELNARLDSLREELSASESAVTDLADLEEAHAAIRDRIRDLKAGLASRDGGIESAKAAVRENEAVIAALEDTLRAGKGIGDLKSELDRVREENVRLAVVAHKEMPEAAQLRREIERLERDLADAGIAGNGGGGGSSKSSNGFANGYGGGTTDPRLAEAQRELDRQLQREKALLSRYARLATPEAGARRGPRPEANVEMPSESDLQLRIEDAEIQLQCVQEEIEERLAVEAAGI